MNQSDHRALRERALAAVEHTRSLTSQDPSWGSEIHALADGWLVLAGAGMYINQAMAAGVDHELASADLDLVVARSAVVGVDPAIEVTAMSLPASVTRIRRWGFVHDPSSDITCLTRPVDATTALGTDGVVVRPVDSAAGLRRWQETSAIGWGHTTAQARRASDAFAAAAHALENEHMVIAYDPADERPVGCASMTVRDGVAMLGGMSTIPTQRRRGVQAALVRHRLDLARQMGCDLAMTTAALGSDSARNLQRHGFTMRITIQRFTPPRTAADSDDG